MESSYGSGEPESEPCGRGALLSHREASDTEASRRVIRSMERGIRNTLLIILGCVFGIILMVFIAAHRLDGYASDESVEQVQRLVDIELDQLAALSREYAWWNEAVEMAIYQQDEEWAEANMGRYLHERYQVSWVLSLDRDGHLASGQHGDEVLATLPDELMTPALKALIERAMDTDFNDPRPASAIMSIQGKLAMVAVTSFTVYEPTERNISQSHGALVLIKDVGKPLLSKWSRDFQIDGLALASGQYVAAGALQDGSESLLLHSSEGERLGILQWAPEKAGQAFLTLMLPWTGVGAGIVLLCSLALYGRLHAYSRVALKHLTELEVTRKALVQQANFDHLTGLANRSLLMAKVAQQMANSIRHHRKAAVLYIDLDGFKEVNDTLGHGYGDEVLSWVAARLQEVVRCEDSVARFGGDEFCMLLSDIETEQDVEHTVERLHDLLMPPITVGNTSVQVGASVGIVIIPDQATNVSDVFRYADIAMYQAKAAGTNQYCFYRPELEGERGMGRQQGGLYPQASLD